MHCLSYLEQRVFATLPMTNYQTMSLREAAQEKSKERRSNRLASKLVSDEVTSLHGLTHVPQ